LELTVAKTETLIDRFAIESGSKWGGYGGGVSVDSGRLSIVPTDSFLGIYSMSNYDLTSSYIMIQLIQPPAVGAGSISLTMNALVSPGNHEAIVWENDQLYFREYISDAPSEVSVAYNAVDHQWLRIRESAGTVYWETSPDSLNWTTQRSKTSGIGALTSIVINIFSGYWDTEPSVGTALLDNFNFSVAPAALAQGWVTGKLPLGGAIDGGVVISRNYFDTADWLWSPIPEDPDLDPLSADIVSLLASTAGGAIRGANLYQYGVTLVGPSGIDESTPRHDIDFVNVPAWGPDPFGSDTVPIPAGTNVPPGSDGHLSFADPTTNKVYSLWQGDNTDGWAASFGGLTDLHGDGIETSGSSTATGLSRYAAVIRGNEIAAGQIPHALFFATDMAHTTEFRYPAIKTDGDNSAGVAHPIPEGTRIQLDPTIDVESIPGITPGEIAVAKALQTYGAYCGDKGGSRMGFIFEYVDDGTDPGQVYVDAGLAWDYFDMTHIPWSSLRVLANWDGS
jgi:hypothetical protein